ncbi:hypothetical protein X798_06415 [Onchocerca flexuosa]|uniref:Uncharacterized protein n=1 Tax=Onchocerca flexuosa TaxID=387005 RepID=A0A238BMZ5_9BILA|nr:hypothetical protein X798_06415 [Onchocerca flexuosa]
MVTADMLNRFKLIRSGINNLHLIETRGIETTSKENIFIPSKEEQLQAVHKQESYIKRPSNWGTDPEIIYGWGNMSSIIKVFLTPLSLEVIQRLMERAEMMLTTINPISIIQHAYASCVSKCHKQLITGKNYVSVQNSLLPAMSAHFDLPPLHVTFFQSIFFNEKILKDSKNKPDITAHSTVTMIYGQECCLNVSSNKQNV